MNKQNLRVTVTCVRQICQLPIGRLRKVGSYLISLSSTVNVVSKNYKLRLDAFDFKTNMLQFKILRGNSIGLFRSS